MLAETAVAEDGDAPDVSVGQPGVVVDASAGSDEVRHRLRSLRGEGLRAAPGDATRGGGPVRGLFRSGDDPSAEDRALRATAACRGRRAGRRRRRRGRPARPPRCRGSPSHVARRPRRRGQRRLGRQARRVQRPDLVGDHAVRRCRRRRRCRRTPARRPRTRPGRRRRSSRTAAASCSRRSGTSVSPAAAKPGKFSTLTSVGTTAVPRAAISPMSSSVSPVPCSMQSMPARDQVGQRVGAEGVRGDPGALLVGGGDRRREHVGAATRGRGRRRRGRSSRRPASPSRRRGRACTRTSATRSSGSISTPSPGM